MDQWSFDHFQRLVDDLMRKHPALLAFVVSAIASMPTTIREHSLLTVVAIARMFERHYGPNFDMITQNDMTHFFHRNGNLIRATANGIGHNTGDVVQPFVLKFASDAGFDVEKEEALEERDALGLLLTLKTVIDVLDHAYGAGRQGSKFDLAAR